MVRISGSSSSELVHSEGDPLRDLPSPGERHWLPRHKAAVVLAVRSKLLSMEEARARYMLNEEEFLSWKEAIDKKGMTGLNAGLRERRGTARQVISEPGIARLYAGVDVNCVITNISDTGARLRFGSTGSLPSTFELYCKKSGRSWWVNLAWQSGPKAGVRFSNPLPPPWTIKSGLAAWITGKRRTVTIDRIEKA